MPHREGGRQPGRHQSSLTGLEARDFEAVASLLASASSRPIERAVMSDEDWAAAAVGRGMPPAAADFTLGVFRASRAGEFAVTHPALETRLGRPARSVSDLVSSLVGR